MKKLCTIILLAFIGLGAKKVNAQIVNIPDNYFFNALINSGVPDSADYITVSIAQSITGSLDIISSNISNLTGIEAFINLRGLDCSYNNLTTLNLSSNKALTSFACAYNSLTSLDVSSNTALTSLDCDYNNLKSINLSSNTALAVLFCVDDSLTSLDLSSNTALATLVCQNNNLTSLDLSSDTALIQLSCYNDGLTSLNVKNGHYQKIPEADFSAFNNPQLFCIEVDNVAYSTSNWRGTDVWAHFTTVCPFTCAANFSLNPDTTQAHHYIATNLATGLPPIEYIWSWGDGYYDTIPYPSHTYADSGFYNICLTVTDSTGCVSTFCDSSYHVMRTTDYMVYINVVPPIITGINSVSTDKTNFNIYPNPFSTKFIVESKGQRATTISIYNTLGAIVYSKKTVGSETIIDMNREPSGIYYIRITADNERTINKKIVKQ